MRHVHHLVLVPAALLIAVMSAGCVILPGPRVVNRWSRWPDPHGPSPDALVGRAGATARVGPGTPRERVRTIVGQPSESDDAGTVEVFSSESHGCKAVCVVPLGHVWLSTFRFFNSYRHLVIRYEESGLVRTAKVLTAGDWEREEERLNRAGTTLRP